MFKPPPITLISISCTKEINEDLHKELFSSLQIVYFGLCLPGFLAQFLPFMQRFKIQRVSNFSYKHSWTNDGIVFFLLGGR